MRAQPILPRGVLLVAFVALVLTPMGCVKQAAERPGSDAVSQESGPASAGQKEVVPVVPEITLSTADLAAYESVLKVHVGKVVLVDFWATWCVPCKKNFPKILGYGREFADQGLAVVSVSFDDAAAEAEVLDFLKSVEATIPNLISEYGAGTESTERFAVDSALPYYKLYDRQGKLRYQFSDVPEGLDHLESVDQIHQRIEELLAEG